MSDSPGGRVVLVTGASRGIGAATASLLGRGAGARVVVHYREKRRRAERVVAAIKADGGEAFAAGADLTDAAAVRVMLDQVAATYRRIDMLVLNASGGLEQGTADDYPLRLNRDAQVNLVQGTAALMPPGSVIVYVTSHPAHFYHKYPIDGPYQPVAHSKRAGEDALRERLPWLSARGIRLVVVSGGMVDGTVTVLLLQRAIPDLMKTWRERSGAVTVAEFAAAICAAATAAHPSGHTVLVSGLPLNGLQRTSL